MSGGAYDYKFAELENTYVGKMHDIELDALMDDLITVLKELEWWQSGDTSQDVYREAVKRFKSKWLGSPRKESAKRLIEETITAAKGLLETALLYKMEEEEYC